MPGYKLDLDLLSIDLQQYCYNILLFIYFLNEFNFFNEAKIKRQINSIDLLLIGGD